MRMKNVIISSCCLIVGFLQGMAESEPSSKWGQDRLESFLLGNAREPLIDGDYGDDDELLPDIPLRRRSSLGNFWYFFSEGGWTTNQLVEGLMLAASNGIGRAAGRNADRMDVARVAVAELGDINVPAVTNFLRWVMMQPECPDIQSQAIVPIFQYTNLEPEVLAYLRTLCLRTNIYERVISQVKFDMLETLETMPSELKPSATNRVAQYMYFALNHTSDLLACQDDSLIKLMPAYSNSIQRLEAMRYIANTATNPLERVNANEAIRELTSIPTNRLNDLKWLAE